VCVCEILLEISIQPECLSQTQTNGTDYLYLRDNNNKTHKLSLIPQNTINSCINLSPSPSTTTTFFLLQPTSHKPQEPPLLSNFFSFPSLSSHHTCGVTFLPPCDIKIRLLGFHLRSCLPTRQTAGVPPERCNVSICRRCHRLRRRISLRVLYAKIPIPV
jgi:hypothetical protein